MSIITSFSSFAMLQLPTDDSDVGIKTCAINLACITYYIYAYHDFWKKPGNSSGIAYVQDYLK